MTDTPRPTASTITDHQLDQLYAELARYEEVVGELNEANTDMTRDLAALRNVARGYCPTCGRGDATPTVTDWEQQRQRADQADAAVARVRQLAARIRQGAPWTANDDTIADRIETALQDPAPAEPAPAATQATDTESCCGKPGGAVCVHDLHQPKEQPTPTVTTGLVVQPYRTDQGRHAWVFRCWGTTTCDGWLSLDHSSEQSAERARDRHIHEAHTEEEPGA
jgi:hypothetical protein